MVELSILTILIQTLDILNYLPITLFIITISNITLNTSLNNYFNIKNLSRFISTITLYLIIFYLLIILLKSFLLVYTLKQGLEINSIVKEFSQSYNINFINPIQSFTFFSDAILILAFSSGFVCLITLGERNLFKNIPTISVFSSFILATTIMVYTTNILIMFLAFECLFVPTIYFVYYLGYTKRSEIATFYLFRWTLSGAFLVLVTLSYVYGVYNTLVYYELVKISFSTKEKIWISSLIFIGFSVKIPMLPFHFWLTKVHVEAPAGFSIYLSGFLVKAAAYCLFILLSIFNNSDVMTIFCWVAILGVLESSCKMWTQTDIKKTIAFATIQEMNIIILLLLVMGNTVNFYVISFILMHGWLSAYMFFFIDVIQKKAGSRNVITIGGMATKIPEIKIYTWIMLIIAAGFPLTIKFIVEYYLLGILLYNSEYLIAIILIFSILIGGLGFYRQFFLFLYNSNDNTEPYTSSTLSKRDKFILNLLAVLLTLLNLGIFFI